MKTIAKKNYTVTTSTYAFGKRKYEEENFDGMGSKRVTVHQGNRADVWEYYTARAVGVHKREVRYGQKVALGLLGVAVIDAILNS